jgi:hypothetical protein
MAIDIRRIELNLSPIPGFAVSVEFISIILWQQQFLGSKELFQCCLCLQNPTTIGVSLTSQLPGPNFVVGGQDLYLLSSFLEHESVKVSVKLLNRHRE